MSHGSSRFRFVFFSCVVHGLSDSARRRVGEAPVPRGVFAPQTESGLLGGERLGILIKNLLIELPRLGVLADELPAFTGL
jgi:hypothetical protein